VNVNPNFVIDINHNPNQLPCERCIDYTHRWGKDLCTTNKRKDGTLVEPALTPTEFAERLKARWDAGFFFNEALSNHASPSAQDSAKASLSAATNIKKSAAGGNGNRK
jgi:hypothetical protein